MRRDTGVGTGGSIASRTRARRSALSSTEMRPVGLTPGGSIRLNSPAYSGQTHLSPAGAITQPAARPQITHRGRAGLTGVSYDITGPTTPAASHRDFAVPLPYGARPLHQGMGLSARDTITAADGRGSINVTAPGRQDHSHRVAASLGGGPGPGNIAAASHAQNTRQLAVEGALIARQGDLARTGTTMDVADRVADAAHVPVLSRRRMTLTTGGRTSDLAEFRGGRGGTVTSGEFYQDMTRARRRVDLHLSQHFLGSMTQRNRVTFRQRLAESRHIARQRRGRQ